MSIVVLFSQYIADNFYAVAFYLVVCRFEAFDDQGECCFIFDEGFDHLVFVVVAHFVNCSEHDWVIVWQILKQCWGGDSPLVNMVDQHPQKWLVLCHDLFNVCSSADDIVAWCDDCHLSDFREGWLQIERKLFLEIFNHLLGVGEFLYILEPCQNYQTFVGEVWV